MSFRSFSLTGRAELGTTVVLAGNGVDVCDGLVGEAIVWIVVLCLLFFPAYCACDGVLMGVSLVSDCVVNR